MQNTGPLLAFVLGAVGGGLVVAVATKAIPNIDLPPENQSR